MDPDLLVFTLLPAGVLLAGAGWCLVGPVKPIADLPYRWGTWRGIFYAVLAVALYVGAFIGGYRALKIRGEPLPVLLGLGIVGILVGLVGAGLLFRRKYGVVLLFLVEGTVGLLAILPAVAKDDHLSSTVGQVLGTVIYLWANASYFAKRWRFMADPSQRAVDHESTRSSNTLAPLGN